MAVLEDECAVRVSVSYSHIGACHGTRLTESQTEISIGAGRNSVRRVLVPGSPEQLHVSICVESSIVAELASIKRYPGHVGCALCGNRRNERQLE
jgi:hypothetical protein